MSKPSLTKEQAIALYDSGWWKGKSAREIVTLQLFEPLLCVPFNVFHSAVEECLRRPVFTHEFGLNWDGLKKEFLGEQPAPTFQQIIDLIPEAKRILVVAP